MRHREIRERGDVISRTAQHGFDLGQLASEHVRDGVELLADVFGIGLSEDGSHPSLPTWVEAPAP